MSAFDGGVKRSGTKLIALKCAPWRRIWGTRLLLPPTTSALLALHVMSTTLSASTAFAAMSAGPSKKPKSSRKRRADSESTEPRKRSKAEGSGLLRFGKQISEQAGYVLSSNSSR